MLVLHEYVFDDIDMAPSLGFDSRLTLALDRTEEDEMLSDLPSLLIITFTRCVSAVGSVLRWLSLGLN